jgi:hypothetical protein
LVIGTTNIKAVPPVPTTDDRRPTTDDRITLPP